ncbi:MULTISPECIES: histidinol dehydrogenase [unclassified Breznakia]|uniref:histidinol dehydrogenase n=1 Tax=unclassified Breznakia TaxID=2623764 RepID=UPI00247487C8|nr:MULTISPECIES: histidinol dehydrogenase [unclassified Breznakia]MDH6367186.1 histidinol dehydrogenase [Breznakia sp. PH1-1]MDH6404394.1 histidinol dehydrogenase [Breznakia sp. PF1-11]MDH6412103.1 histidinol dehydrogenase [Breznakia sp. PFB1-11]MDH6414382.1 histidinol dehydrogenase [Breznakia sp. PFB1-14]MDH6416688.1 histidinol dehydrogenase [Breznakia sp. PFB1-4]
MLKQIDIQDKAAFNELLQARSMEIDPNITASVLDILRDVKNRKDEALKEYTNKFDGVSLDSFTVSKEEIDEAYANCDPNLIAILEEAKENITFYHEAQKRQGYELEKDNGVYMGQRVIPLEKVGIYVPGGRSPYPSTVLMDVIPAKIAGVKEVIMVSPPNKEGKINPVILATAKVAGVDTIYKVGGAQAIAALAYGTESIPRVDKIVGPGNIYVAEAKKLVYGQVDIDMVAGPSEILVIADAKANPVYIAADLMSQAEHDPMASSILISTSKTLIDQVEQELAKQIKDMPRKDIIETSFNAYGYAMVVSSIEEAITYSNAIAPEHLELMVEDAKEYLPLVTNAGSVFLGYYSCESIGDYFGGTNHVLPTNGTARFYSPLGVHSFVKTSSYLYYPKEVLLEEGRKIATFAKQEELFAHANAVEVRLDNEKD